jgi:hypothetical protein
VPSLTDEEGDGVLCDSLNEGVGDPLGDNFIGGTIGGAFSSSTLSVGI